MRVLRPFLWAAVLVAAFLYLTSAAHWDVGTVLRPVRNVERLWTEPASAATAGGYTADEQNNIDIYHSATRRHGQYHIDRGAARTGSSGAYPGKGTGSGFIINPDGQILTNNHVVRGTAQLDRHAVRQEKSTRRSVLGTDPRNDLALIKIDAGRKLPALQLGDSDHLVVGQKVLAIGNPFGFGGTLTTGIVSSLDRTIQTEEERAGGHDPDRRRHQSGQ